MDVDVDAEGCVCVTNGTAGAASRKQIAIGKCDPASWEGLVQLFWEGGGGVKVYTDASGGAEVASGMSFANESLPTNLWVEGTAPSAAVGDVVFRLNPVEAVCPNAAEGCDRGTMTVVRVDVDVDGLAEPEEETVPGGVVCVTNSPNRAVSRRMVTVQKAEPSDWDGEVKLAWGADNIRMCTASNGAGEVSSGVTFANTALPTNLWVEGTAASATAGDVILKVMPVGVTCNHSDTGCDWARMTMILVDVDAEGLDDLYEETAPGALVCVTNGHSQTAVRKQITMQQAEPTDWEGEVELLWTAGKVKVYTAPSNGVEVTSGQTFANAALPTNLWVSGVELSGTTGDVVFRLNPKDVDCPHTATGCDRMVMTVIRVDLAPYTEGSAPNYETWLPVLGGNVLLFQAKVYPSTFMGHFDFFIDDSTKYPGYCMNAPYPLPEGTAQHSASWSDLRFVTPQPLGCRVNVSGSQDNIALDSEAVLANANRVAVKADDYAAWGKLRCTAHIKTWIGFSATWVSFDAVVPDTGASHIVIPLDADDNKIADAATSWNSGSPGDDTDTRDGVTVQEGAPDFPGDALLRFEEYRGFVIQDGAETAVLRSNPEKRDYFYWNGDVAVLDTSLFTSQSHLLTHAVPDNGRTATELLLNFARNALLDSTVGITTKHQVAPSLIIDNTIDGRGNYDPNNHVARVNVERLEIELELEPGVTLADSVRNTTAHELGHSCWLDHHGDVSQNNFAGMKGPVCIMRYFVSETVFCPYATPCPGGVNAETNNPTVYDVDSWDCEPGRGDCLHRLRVNPVWLPED